MDLPNILYLHSHDTGRFVQPYGHAVPTPNLQRLAGQGVLFRQAFCAAPTCSPSRAALLTGQCPHSSGMLGLAHRGFSLNETRQHLVHTLRRAGYHSALAGIQHVAKTADEVGYDQILDVPSRGAADVAPAAADFLDQTPEQPFFLSAGFFETHREFPAVAAGYDDAGDDDAGYEDAGAESTGDDSRYSLPPAGLPDTPATRRDMAGYRASARILDQGIGRVLDALDRNGLADNTLVICTTDHGIAFPGHKCNLTDRGMGVMLIVRGPGGFHGGRVLDAMVSHVDLFPTICDLLALDPPGWLQGNSILPLVRGEVPDAGDAVNDQVFAEVTYHAAYEPKRAVRTARWKYIRRYGEQETPVLPNCDDGPSKQVWLDHGWQSRTQPREQLYDLIFDPQESNNLAEDPSVKLVLDDMRARLDNWMQETDDPLLRGPVPAPSGAEINDPLGLSPNEPAQIVP